MVRGVPYAHVVACAASFLIAVSMFWLPASVDWNSWYDLKTRASMSAQSPPEQRVVIVDIDERSLEAEGRWPWARQRIAELLLRLCQDYRVSIVGVDILFPDETEQDMSFYRQLENLPITFAQAFQFPAEGAEVGAALARGRLVSPVKIERAQKDLNVPEAQGFLAASFPSNLKPQWQGGHITPRIDSDGIVRQVAPLIGWDNRYYEMLSLSLIRQLYLLDGHYNLSDGRNAGDAARILTNGPLSIQLDAFGFANINYAKGPGRGVRYISALDVLEQSIEPAVLEGKVIILGSTATRLHDQIVTPIASVYPAVELHANLLTSLLDNTRWRYTPRWESWLLAGLVIVMFIVTAFCVKQQFNRLAIISMISISVVWCGVSLLIWQQQLHLRVWPVLLNMVILLAIYIPAALNLYLRQRKSIKELFSSYVPLDVVNVLLKTPETAVGMTPEKREMTVLFADLKGFSRLAEEVSPEVLADYMKQVFDAMTEAVYRHGGTVDKYMGDALMAFWGAPVADQEHALNAVLAACDINKAVSQLAVSCIERNLPRPEIGIGVNSGEMIVGDMGSSYRRSYTVIGDSVNQAERLQKLTRKYEFDILVSQSTVGLIPPEKISCSILSLGAEAVSGRTKPVYVYALASNDHIDV